jgi:hypothetical protein
MLLKKKIEKKEEGKNTKFNCILIRVITNVHLEE